jgi:D-3-phosphoglycerate dehydrogenase / 2-oxoglutarate reductase
MPNLQTRAWLRAAPQSPNRPFEELARSGRPTTLRPMSWKVLITARTLTEVGKEALAILRAAGCELTIPPRFGPYPADELQPLVNGHDAVFASMDKFTPAVLSSAEAARLKMISRWGVGYDAIDMPAATANGIVIAYTPGLLNETVADFAFALLLSVARQVHIGHQNMSQGLWKGAWGTDVFGKTLGIIGCGRIGQAMARRASGFNMRLLGHDIHCDSNVAKAGIQLVSLDELLAQSDFISLHAALTPASRGMIGEAQLRQMKPGAYLINTARGALVDEAALAAALHEKRIAGAALDAFVVEPMPAEHPLRTAPNVLLTPHLASFARETGERVSTTAAQAIVDMMHGRKPQFVVNPEVFKTPSLRATLK